MTWISNPIFISHRGNLTGKHPHLENDPNYVMEALMAGFDVEIDLWVKDHGILFLGHDEPQYQIHRKFLENKNLWVHCKNEQALNFCSKWNGNIHYFWHDTDAYTLTSKGYIWGYPGKSIVDKGVCVLPEREGIIAEKLHKNVNLVAICSDNIVEYKTIFDKLNGDNGILIKNF